MRYYLMVCWMSLCAIFSCTPAPASRVDEEEEPQDTLAPVTPVQPSERTLAAPENLTLTLQDGAVVLTWDDVSFREEGYLVDKVNSGQGFSEQYFISANATSWTDNAVLVGKTVYSVRSYWHTDRSDAASVVYEKKEPAAFSVKSVTSSPHMVAVTLEITSDGGEEVVCGVEYRKQGSSDAKTLTFASRLRTGGKACLLAEKLESGVSYLFKPFAENSSGRVYLEERTASLQAAPSPLALTWTDVPSGDLPEGVTVRKCSTDELGHHVNLWCATADLTKGTVEMRTTKASSIIVPSEYVKNTLSGQGDVIALVNGGYFEKSNSASYSYVCDRGSKKASNVSMLTRTDSYYVTRGFFGVDSSGNTAIGWTSSGDAFWAEPLPVYDGGPVLSSTYPLETITGWSPYNVIGGGPVLLKDGRYCFDFLTSPGGKYLSNHELFQTDVYSNGLRAPRTAIGTDGNGTIVLLVADGRDSGGSTGLTFEEEARIMAGLGCKDVMNLDGGGSSMFLTGNSATLQNKPSDGSERKILTFVSFMKK